MSGRSRDALSAPNPLQVHAHTTLQGTLFGCTPRSLSQAFYAVPQAPARPSAPSARALRAGAAQNFAANAAHVKVEG